ncbi:MAG: hypothetical protein ACW99Q_00415 [Candidatus Kariarchaeaceae archaeon]|jgi:hypothetical protein
MLPILDSGVYNTQQFINWQVDYYDSSMTVPETGIGFRLGEPDSTFKTLEMQTTNDPIGYMDSGTSPVFTDDSGNWIYGRTALVNEYWESGGLPGITTARFSVLHWRGDLTSDWSWIDTPNTGKYFLGFSGNGHIRVNVDGSTVLTERLSPSAISSTAALTGTGQVDIFYWQLGESWGGVVGKFVPQEDMAAIEPTTAQYRAAPVISASIVPYSTATATTLSGIAEVSLSVDGPNSARRLSLKIPLADNIATSGWNLLTNPRRLQYIPVVGDTLTLKTGQLIKFYGGFTNELYERFMGHIVDFDESKGMVTVECQSIDYRLSKYPVENYPDRISYDTFGYFLEDSTSEPIRDVPAYDFWPLEYAIQDLCYKAKVDPKLFYGMHEYESNNTAVTKIDKTNTKRVYDSFSDSNGTNLTDHSPETGQTWEQATSITIQSNKASYTGGGMYAWVDDYQYDDLRVAATGDFSAGGSDGRFAVAWNIDSGAAYNDFTGYIFRANQTSTSAVTLQVVRFVDDSPTVLFSGPGYSWSAGTPRRLAVEAEDNAFTCYLSDADGTNELIVGTIVDSGSPNYYGKQVGFFVDAPTSGTITVDNFETSPYRYSKRFNARSVSGNPILLQRNPRYGNAGTGFSPDKPSDDQYLYRPDVTKGVDDYIRGLSDGFGYDFRSAADGSLSLTTRNNPSSSVDLFGGTTVYEPNAYGGWYQKFTSSFTIREQVFASRIDLIIGRKESLGSLSYTIKTVDGTTVGSGTLNTALTGETSGIFLYDDRFTLDGNNAVITTLFTGPWNRYIVEISDSSGSEWWIDSLFLYDFDPNTSSFAESFNTDKAIFDLTTQSQLTEARNHIVVIGKRKSAITDSAKFKNPNNPSYEFVVSVSSDPSSIWDQDSDFYAGGKSEVLIVDKSVADQDYADWLSQTLLLRQHNPTPSPQISHSIVPVLEPRDPIYISDEAHVSITAATTVWIVGFSEQYTPKSATTRFTATGYKEIPSYEPREDIDLDTLDSVYFGRPAINFSVSYPSVDSGITATNPGGGIPISYMEEITRDAFTISSDGEGEYLDLSSVDVWPPIPDSIRVSNSNNPILSDFVVPVLKNNPYQKIWHIHDYTVKKVHIPFEMGDGTTNYQRAAWFTGSTGYLSYRGLPTSLDSSDIYSGESPFYDPYTSELPDGNLVEVKFDALVSGYYRVAIWGQRQDGSDPMVIAWLTESGVDDEEKDSHWTYYQAGTDKVFYWDGVDSIGRWNKKQSETYSWVARGVFEQEQKPAIGKGFYVWNDQNSQVVTISGQQTNGKLTFNDDHYSQFYIKVECRSDLFANTDEPIREVRSDQLITTNGQNPQEEIYIYTHLPPPSQMRISAVEDWDPTVGTYDPESPDETGWLSSPDNAATIRNGKPVRITFEALSRPGVRFEGQNKYTTFKVHRHVHLTANIFDIFMMFMGKPWLEGVSVEEKRLVCRKLTNSTNTTVIADTDFRTGDTLDITNGKWVFQPQDFEIDDKELTYCDYLQLEDVPEFSEHRRVGETQSRFLMAYINYLFYISAYTQDRSGRMVWAIDDSFIDKGKITQGTFETEWPEDLENYFKRTVMTRQWNNPQYYTDLANDWNITDSDGQKYVQFFWNRLNPTDVATTNLRLDSNGDWVTGDLQTSFSDVRTFYHWGRGHVPINYDISRQLGDYPGNLDIFGDWFWEGTQSTAILTNTEDHDPLWIPAPSRDFHGYYMVPPMVSPPNRSQGVPDDYSYVYEYVQPDGDKDFAASEVWFGWTLPITAAGNMGFKIASTAKSHAEKEREVWSSMMDYQRQDELIKWEELRGNISQSKIPRSRVFVQPSGGYYLQNFYRYDKIFWIGKQFSIFGHKVAHTEADITDYFQSTFRHKYNWESASYFPAHEASLSLRPQYLYPKYEARNIPSYIVYDAGAWVGWKGDSAGSKLRWRTYDLALFGGGGGDVGGEDDGEDNIFQYTTVPPIAVGPSTPEQKNIMVSLSLVNRRRSRPVPGH